MILILSLDWIRFWIQNISWIWTWIWISFFKRLQIQIRESKSMQLYSAAQSMTIIEKEHIVLEKENNISAIIIIPLFRHCYIISSSVINYPCDVSMLHDPEVNITITHQSLWPLSLLSNVYFYYPDNSCCLLYIIITSR